MAKIWNTKRPKCWLRCGTIETLTYCWQKLSDTCKIVCQFPIKLHILLLYDLASCSLVLSKMNYIHNCQDLEATKMSFTRWMSKCMLMHSDNGILVSIKKKWILCWEKIWKKLKCILRGERSQSAKAVYHRIPATWHSGNGKTTRLEKDQWWQQCGEKGRGRQGPGDF